MADTRTDEVKQLHREIKDAQNALLAAIRAGNNSARIKQSVSDEDFVDIFEASETLRHLNTKVLIATGGVRPPVVDVDGIWRKQRTPEMHAKIKEALGDNYFDYEAAKKSRTSE